MKLRISFIFAMVTAFLLSACEVASSRKSSSLAPGSVEGSMLANGAVNSSNIASGAVGTQQLSPALNSQLSSFVVNGGQAGAVSIGPSNSSSLSLLSGGVAALTVASSTSIGIGTSSPDSPLSVSANAVAPPAPTTGTILHLTGLNAKPAGIQFDSFAGSGLMWFRRAGGTAASPAALAANDSIMTIAAQGFNGTAYSGNQALIRFLAAEAWTSTAVGTDINFSTTTNGTTAAAERMRITNAGNVGIGVSAPVTRLQVAGEIAPSLDNAFTLGDPSLRFAEVHAVNGVIQTSDARLKKEVANSDLGLEFVQRLRPVSFRWKDGTDSDLHYGFIAQETWDAVPVDQKSAIVSRDMKADRFGMRYTELLAPVVKAVQELASQLSVAAARQESKTAEIEELKRKNALLEARITALEKRLELR